MQRGEVDPYLRPLMRLVLRGEEGTEEVVEVHLDTGFTRSLAVPPRVIAALQFPFVREVRMTLADGQREKFNEYRGRVLWEGIERPVRVLAKEGSPLVGMAMFHGYRVTLEVVDGGTVTVEPLS